MDSQVNILSNFVSMVKETERRLSEGQDDYALEFLKIRFDSDDLRELDEFKSVVGSRPDNFRKNRYRDILPFDYSRVTIDTKPARTDSSNYINASFINGANDKVAYIATQGPLKETLADFWQMIYQYEVNVVVMLCDLIESGKPKCEKYWPDSGSKLKFGELRITQVSEVRERDHYVLRTFRMKRKGSSEKERIIFQFQYFGWPDHGTPDEIAPLLEFVDRLRDYQPEDQFSPMVVHCSAGCGRTGTICALDFVRTLIRSKRVPAEFTVSNLVSELRKQRPAMVQSKEQYMLVHRAIACMFEQQLNTTSNPLKVNVSELFISSPPSTPAPPIPANNSSSPKRSHSSLAAPVVSLSPSLSSGMSGTSTSDDTTSSTATSQPDVRKSPICADEEKTVDRSTNSIAVVTCGFGKENDTASQTSYETMSTTKSEGQAGSDNEEKESKPMESTQDNAMGHKDINGAREKFGSIGPTDLEYVSRKSPVMEPYSGKSEIASPSSSAAFSSHEMKSIDTKCDAGALDFPVKLAEHPTGFKAQPSSWPDPDEILGSVQHL